MSVLLDLRAAIVARITEAMPKGWSVEGHQGRFGAGDLNRFLTVAPAVRVAILGLSDPLSIDADAVQWRVKIGVFVVTRDQGKTLAREQIAAAAVETLCLLAFGQRFGLGSKGVQPASAATAQVLFNEDSLNKGVALWGIDWTQPIVLSRPEAEAWPLKQLWLGLAPEIGPDHVDAYLGPIPSDEGGHV